MLLKGSHRWYTSANARLKGVGVRGASESLWLRIGLVFPASSKELLGVVNEEVLLLLATGVDWAVGYEFIGEVKPKFSD